MTRYEMRCALARKSYTSRQIVNGRIEDWIELSTGFRGAFDAANAVVDNGCVSLHVVVARKLKALLIARMSRSVKSGRISL